MLTIYKGRPENIDDREPREVRVYDLLDSLNIEGVKRTLALFAPPIDPAMLVKAKAEYNTLRGAVMRTSSNDIEDTSPSFKTVEDDGANQLSKEEASQLAARQYKFIQNLEAALARIENKTYGICRVTGKLIPKERLRLVPHATLTVEAKEMLSKSGKN